MRYTSYRIHNQWNSNLVLLTALFRNIIATFVIFLMLISLLFNRVLLLLLYIQYCDSILNTSHYCIYTATQIYAHAFLFPFKDTYPYPLTSIVNSMKLPEVLCSYTSVVFQLIFDRLMKALITAQKNGLAGPTQPRAMPILSLHEKNVVYTIWGEGGGGICRC